MANSNPTAQVKAIFNLLFTTNILINLLPKIKLNVNVHRQTD